jgi:hypothetical protein
MLASFDFDQAEGLRRMLSGPKPRIVTFLSATASDDKGAMLVNLGASLVQSGNDVVIVDACARDYGVARRLGVDGGGSLLQVARQECALNQVIHQVPQGFSVVEMGHPDSVVPAKAGPKFPCAAGSSKKLGPLPSQGRRLMPRRLTIRAALLKPSTSWSSSPPAAS